MTTNITDTRVQTHDNEFLDKDGYGQGVPEYYMFLEKVQEIDGTEDPKEFLTGLVGESFDPLLYLLLVEYISLKKKSSRAIGRIQRTNRILMEDISRGDGIIQAMYNDLYITESKLYAMTALLEENDVDLPHCGSATGGTSDRGDSEAAEEGGENDQSAVEESEDT
jgi:hypothetical protein